eukprot:gb/GECG01010396.1/.p1 GENE.gb/GECG01010396.1/~~gb/GECG01010396.1/.p1  ORF type:complete len:243 (+),score=37.06 gb/GECG01010396.1/:1-729(+)
MTPARRMRDMRKQQEEMQKYYDDKYDEFYMACENDRDSTGCHSLGEWWAVVKQDYEKAANIYFPNCHERDHASSCLNLGLLKATGRGVQRNMNEAVELFKKGCSLGNADCCTAAGMEQASGKNVEQDLKQAKELLKKACGQVGQSKACNKLGEMYLVGKHGCEKDLPAASYYLKRACDEGKPLACRNLALMYLRGEGVEYNEETARQYWDKMYDIKEQETGGPVIRKGLPKVPTEQQNEETR